MLTHISRPDVLNRVRPEMQAKLSRLVSCVPGFEFCASCVEASPENELLKSEIVDAYADVEAEVEKLVGSEWCIGAGVVGFYCDHALCLCHDLLARPQIRYLDSSKHPPIDSADLRRVFHSHGVNMTFLGKVYHSVTLLCVKHLILCDAVSRVVKRGIRESCQKSTSRMEEALQLATRWVTMTLQYLRQSSTRSNNCVSGLYV